MITLDKSNDNYVIASFASAVKKLNILIADKTKQLLKEVINEGKPYIILNLENIAYIDSSGFGTIISLFNHAKNCDVSFLLCNVSDANMSLIKITKLNDVLKIHADLDSAIAHIKKHKN